MSGMIYNSATESVDIAAAAMDDMFVGGGTIMCRFNANSFGFGTNFGRLLDKASTTGAALGWSLQLDDPDTLRFEYGWTTTNGNWVTIPGISINTGTEYHAALTYNDGAVGNNPSIYVNGVLQTLNESSTPAGSAESDAAQTLGIGNIPATAYNRGFDGFIGDVRCYARELSAAEIVNIVNTQVPYPYDQHLMMPMMEGAVGVTPAGGGDVKDHSPSAADGTVNSTPIWAESTFGALRRRAS